MEAIWADAELPAGGAYAHSTVALNTIGEVAPWSTTRGSVSRPPRVHG
jgi:hypothetical protein